MYLYVRNNWRIQTGKQQNPFWWRSSKHVPFRCTGATEVLAQDRSNADGAGPWGHNKDDLPGYEACWLKFGGFLKWGLSLGPRYHPIFGFSLDHPATGDPPFIKNPRLEMHQCTCFSPVDWVDMVAWRSLGDRFERQRTKTLMNCMLYANLSCVP